MSLISQGYGKGKGSPIVMGMGFWERIRKIVKTVISRLIPKYRRPFRFVIPVYGDTLHEFRMEIKVRGKKDISELLWLLFDDEDEDVDA